MDLKIVYSDCCGIDVHKSFVVVCIAATHDKGITTYKKHRFSTLPAIFAGLPNGCPGTTAGMCLHGIHRQILDTRVQHP
jgi:hypothetical protein